MDELRSILESELERHPYNTVGSFLDFYEAFNNQTLPVDLFYRTYCPQVLPKSLSCVGLACSLLDRLKSSLEDCYPGLKSALYVSSCEEMIGNVDTYVSCSPPSQSLSVKEHVLVVLKIVVEGRDGYIVLDPGYHVNIPVVVMCDGLYPNTGWFLLSETSKSKKEYCYEASDAGPYIKWHVKDTRKGKCTSWTNLIYVGRRFLSYVTVSEKRNLVFNFRTVVARDRKKPVAGFYVNLEGEERFTFFYQAFVEGVGTREEVQIPFDYFRGQSTRDVNRFESALSSCATQVGWNVTLMSQIAEKLVEAYSDDTFMPGVQVLNRKIDEE